MKPAYVSVVYKAKDSEITIEGWLTQPKADDPAFYITPSLDFDDDVMKIGLLWSSIISITPVESVRAYYPRVAQTWDEVAVGGNNKIIVRDLDGTVREVDIKR